MTKLSNHGGNKPGPFGVKDLERMIYGRASDARSSRQRQIRRILRDLGLGVGYGHRYQWNKTTLKKRASIVKKLIRQRSEWVN